MRQNRMVCLFILVGGIVLTSIFLLYKKDNDKRDNEQKRIVAYYASWDAGDRNVRLTDIDYSLVTHVNLAFANLMKDGTIVVGTPMYDERLLYDHERYVEGEVRGHLGEIKYLKEQYPNVKFLISVGGWTWSEAFSSVASTEETRRQFAKSAVEFVRKYQLDGIDIDWEFPVSGGLRTEIVKEDKENFTKLVQALYEALQEETNKTKKEYLISLAVGAEEECVNHLELTKLVEYVDFFNIMTYNYHGTWESITNHNTPFYSVVETIDHYLNQGVASEQINLGVAFYGYAWKDVTCGEKHGLYRSGNPAGISTFEGGTLEYWDIKKNYVNQNGFVRYFDWEAKVPYLYNGDIFITYEDTESLKEKANLVLERELGGIMFWEFSQDKEKELQRAICETLH